ncbi:unnamed protein product [Oncorhynchus mykiss]|uniref:Uncharacterized protein n=1 Tax=Oncorhynchus mykiss TaxID=8022 RepID=A0A060WEM9_ONCMY|nr:unnamed protein product [Oncorhynchus mykiss]
MEGDGSTTDASQLGMPGEYMAGSHYVLQSQDDDCDESLHDHEEGNGSKENFREQDIYLPIANVARIMKNAVPQTGKVWSVTCFACFLLFIYFYLFHLFIIFILLLTGIYLDSVSS